MGFTDIQILHGNYIYFTLLDYNQYTNIMLYLKKKIVMSENIGITVL